MYFFEAIYSKISIIALFARATVWSSRTRSDTYTNPIVPGHGADPWVVEFDNNYYLTMSTGSNVQVRKSSSFANFDVDPVVVYTPPQGMSEVWAPELHRIDGNFFIYFSMDKNGNNATHRMYVLQGTNASDPTAPFDLVGQIGTADNHWAIDGTVLTTTDDLGTYGINEGPEMLVNANRTFLVYSAGASWTQYYCLALMGIDKGVDPLIPSNWWALDTNPVMRSSDVAFGPGHASFPRDRNGVPYVVYHANDIKNGGWSDRTVRTQTFNFSADGCPAFPAPVALGLALPAPA